MSISSRAHATVAHLARSPSAPRHPFRLVVEISNACNLRCVFCPRTTSMTRPVALMDVDLFDEIMESSASHLESVGLNGYGEPLIHPDLVRFVESARRRQVSVSVSTNCTLLDEERSRALLASHVDFVTLAIDGVDQAAYDAVRVGADFAQVMENATRFLELWRRTGSSTHVVVQCIVTEATRARLREVWRFWRRHDVAVRLRQLTHTGNWQGDRAFVQGRGPCYWLWTEPMVLSDGTVVPCCQDVNGQLALGQISERSLAEHWSGDVARALRSLHGAGRREEIAICRSCNMYQPTVPLALGAAVLDTRLLNRLVPAVETLLSWYRYR